MDSLDNLPVTPTVLTPKEEASMQRLFQKSANTSAPQDSSNIKLALGCLTGIFVLLVNPWTTGVIETGIFSRAADIVFVGKKDKVIKNT